MQEKIAFGRMWESLCLVFMLIAVAVGVAIVRHALAECDEDRYSDWDFPGFMAGVLTVGVAVGALLQIREVVLVWFAPRLYIIEWLTGMISSN